MRGAKALLFLIIFCPGLYAQQKDSTWSVKGTAQISLNGYTADGITNRREPFRYTLSFRPILVKNNWRIPIEITAYNVGIGSDYKFMRFGIHPSWKWGKLHFGHTNMRLSSFSISGRTLLGAGVELNPGLFRFAAFYGTTKQSTASFLTNTVQSNVYAQNIFTTKIGFGNRSHFIDLILLKGKDDSTSVDSTRLRKDQYPEENVVIAARTEHYFFKKKWVIGGEFAVSGLTTNQDSKPVSDEPIPILSLLWEPKVSSIQANALEAFIAYRGKIFNTKFAYQRIGPGYRSMGAYFFQNDLESFDISFGIKLLKNKLRIKSKGGLMRNNLANDRTFQSVRARGFLQLFYRPSKQWTIMANYSNYQTEQILQSYDQRDSLRTAIVSNNINGSVQYLLKSKSNIRQTIRATGGVFSSTNKQDFDRNVAESKTFNAALNYQIMKNQWQLQLGLNYLGFEQIAPTNHRYGNQIEIAKSWNKNKWRLSLGSSQIWSFRGTTQTTINWTPNTTFSYRPNVANSFVLRVLYFNNSFATLAGTNFSEWQLSLKYKHRFGYSK